MSDTDWAQNLRPLRITELPTSETPKFWLWAPVVERRYFHELHGIFAGLTHRDYGSMAFGMDEKAPGLTFGQESLPSTGPASVLGQSSEPSLIPKQHALSWSWSGGFFPCKSQVKRRWCTVCGVFFRRRLLVSFLVLPKGSKGKEGLTPFDMRFGGQFCFSKRFCFTLEGQSRNSQPIVARIDSSREVSRIFGHSIPNWGNHAFPQASPKKRRSGAGRSPAPEGRGEACSFLLFGRLFGRFRSYNHLVCNETTVVIWCKSGIVSPSYTHVIQGLCLNHI